MRVEVEVEVGVERKVDSARDAMNDGKVEETPPYYTNRVRQGFTALWLGAAETRNRGLIARKCLL
jgi:hypothetical protein